MQAVLYGIDQHIQSCMLEPYPFQTGIAQHAYEKTHRRDREPNKKRGPHDLPERWIRRKD